MAAADALGALRDPAAADGLLALLRSDEDLVRDCALRNLAVLALAPSQRQVVEEYQRSVR
jgi:HEAT repeat protein